MSEPGALSLSVSGPSALSGLGALCVGPGALLLFVSGPVSAFSGALCVRPRRYLYRVPTLSVSGPGARQRSLCRLCVARRSLSRGPVLSVSGPGAQRTLCQDPALSRCSLCQALARRCLCPAPAASMWGPVLSRILSRGLALSVSEPGALCVARGASVSGFCVLGPGGLCVGAQRSLALCVGPRRSLALCVGLLGPGALCPPLCLSRSSALSRFLCRGPVLGPGTLRRLSRGRAPIRVPPIWPAAPAPIFDPPAIRFFRAHPAPNSNPLQSAQIRVPPMQPGAFPGTEPQTLLFGGKASVCAIKPDSLVLQLNLLNTNQHQTTAASRIAS